MPARQWIELDFFILSFVFLYMICLINVKQKKKEFTGLYCSIYLDVLTLRLFISRKIEFTEELHLNILLVWDLW